jgi:hypothetical protein
MRSHDMHPNMRFPRPKGDPFLTVRCKDGRLVDLHVHDTIQINDKSRDEPWIDHLVCAHFTEFRGDPDHDRAYAYLRIAYIPQDRWAMFYPDIFAYLTRRGHDILSEDRHHKGGPRRPHWRKLERDILERLANRCERYLRGGYVRDPVDRSAMDRKALIAEIAEMERLCVKKARDSFEKFRDFHLERPYVGFIQVEDEHPDCRRNRLALALYLTGSLWLSENRGLLLHGSDLARPEAEAAWQRMAGLGLVIKPAAGRRALSSESVRSLVDDLRGPDGVVDVSGELEFRKTLVPIL